MNPDDSPVYDGVSFEWTVISPARMICHLTEDQLKAWGTPIIFEENDDEGQPNSVG